MKTRTEWLAERQARADATDLGQQMRAAGFEPKHMGGGWLAWFKEGANPNFYCLITVDDSEPSEDDLGDELPNPNVVKWLAGLHSISAEEAASLECIGIGKALAWCSNALRDPRAAFETFNNS